MEIIEAEVCSGHIHMLVSILPKMSVPGFAGFLKGKSTLGKNAKAKAEHIKHQLDEDKIQAQITMKEFTDPFKGGRQQTPRS